MRVGRLLKGSAAVALVVLTATAAWAQPAWPTRRIKLVVPASAGGSADAVGRILADGLSKVLGQTVIVENIPSMASIAGIRFVARSNPDGYTLLISSASIVILPSLRDDIGYNVKKDLTPVSQINSSSHVLAVSTEKSPAKTLPALVQMLREKPGHYNYASSGFGSTPHLMAELFMDYSGTQMNHVPYKSSGESGLAVLSGQVDVTIDAMPAMISYVQQGLLRALAVATPARVRELPDVPSMKKFFPEFPPTELWLGIFVRSATPQPIVDKLNRAIDDALHTPEAVQRLTNTGSNPVGGSQAAFAQRVQGDAKVWEELIKSRGIRAQ
jgi:tripartite-type tricarboxylate transporter receptor subunit TctC